MAKTIMLVAGMDGQIELMTDRVVIHRPGIWNMFKYGLNARREIPLGAISEIIFKPAGKLKFGEIEFMRAGGNTNTGKANLNAVHFNKKVMPQFEALKEKAFEMVDQLARQRQ